VRADPFAETGRGEITSRRTLLRMPAGGEMASSGNDEEHNIDWCRHVSSDLSRPLAFFGR
jgi:hypothetical protein